MTQAVDQSYSPPTNNGAGNGVPGNLLEQAAQAEKKLKWAKWVDAEFTKCKNARSNHEQQWYLNLAFVNGRHYVNPVDVPGQGFRLRATRAPAWRVRLVVNKTRTAIRTEQAKLIANKPIPIVVPATQEVDDASASQVAEQLLKTAFADTKFNSTYRSWIWWGVVCGTSFMKSYWSPNEPDDDLMQPAKPVLGIDGKPLMGENGQPITEQVPVVGKIAIERITPFHIYVPDLLAESIEDQPYVIHCMTRSVEACKRDFPKAGEFKADCKASSTVMESSFIVTKNSEAHLDSVLVKEVWIKPGAHPDFPKGGVLSVANNKLVQCIENWPWPFKEFPFYKYDGMPTGGFYGDSICVDLIPLNKEYNRTKSQMIEIKNILGKPKGFYQQGSLNPRMISSEPGQMIPVKPGFTMPVLQPGVEVPASMSVELDRLNSDFDDISGQHEITRGNTPAQVTSGTAIAFLQEQDDSKLTNQVASIEAAVEKLGRHYLKYVATYWNEERLVRIVGKDSSFEAIHFKGSSLKGNTDVRVQAGSALPFSKAAKQAQLTEWGQNGWLEPTTVLEMAGMGGVEKALEEILIDKRQAQRENLKMATLPDDSPTINDPNSQPQFPVNSWDDHEQHIMWHNNFRKTQEFEQLTEGVKRQFELHVQLHVRAMTEAMQGEIATLNDPNAPVKDPETGLMVPNPLSQGGQEPPVGPDGEPASDMSQVQAEQQMELDYGREEAEQGRKQEMHEAELESKVLDMQLKKKLADKKLREKKEGGKGSAPKGD